MTFISVSVQWTMLSHLKYGGDVVIYPLSTSPSLNITVEINGLYAPKLLPVIVNISSFPAWIVVGLKEVITGEEQPHIFEFIVCICLYLYAAINVKIQRVFENYTDRNYRMRIE